MRELLPELRKDRNLVLCWGEQRKVARMSLYSVALKDCQKEGRKSVALGISKD
jgi:hypothetical protein